MIQPGSSYPRTSTSSLLIAFISIWFAFPSLATPRHVYLTWQGDTSTTITINYQTMDEAQTSSVYYDTRSGGQRISNYRFHATGTRHKIDGLHDGRTIHWVKLTQLEPGRTYYFVAGDPQSGFTEERKFRTIPDGNQKLRFVDGGDMGTGPALAPLLQQAARREPNFAMVGGDIAYANDMPTNYTRWDGWLDAWEHNMITPKGFTIPVVLAIGNHEVYRGIDLSATNHAALAEIGLSPTNSVFYLGYFAQSHDRTYYSRKFGKNLVVYVLDSEHVSPLRGLQATWLNAQLEADKNIPYRFAVYHVPLYPSSRPYDTPRSVAGRNAWLQIFDKHHLTTAFEHHDHSFKRTYLLRNNQIDPNGTLYLGDGCWGMPARKVENAPRWYEAKAGSIQHFWLVDISRSHVEYRAINKDGKIFDVYPPDARGAKAAEKVFSSLPPPPQPPAAPPVSK